MPATLDDENKDTKIKRKAHKKEKKKKEVTIVYLCLKRRIFRQHLLNIFSKH
jgi:hypothetical protein